MSSRKSNRKRGLSASSSNRKKAKNKDNVDDAHNEKKKNAEGGSGVMESSESDFDWDEHEEVLEKKFKMRNRQTIDGACQDDDPASSLALCKEITRPFLDANVRKDHAKGNKHVRQKAHRKAAQELGHATPMRVRLPKALTDAIRADFPDANGKCTGFREWRQVKFNATAHTIST